MRFCRQVRDGELLGSGAIACAFSLRFQRKSNRDEQDRQDVKRQALPIILLIPFALRNSAPGHPIALASGEIQVVIRSMVEHCAPGFGCHGPAAGATTFPEGHIAGPAAGPCSATARDSTRMRMRCVRGAQRVRVADTLRAAAEYSGLGSSDAVCAAHKKICGTLFMLARSTGAAACETQDGYYIRKPTGVGFPRLP